MPLHDMLGEPAIYVVRHGETELNHSNKFRGFIDVPLDDNGRKQAREARDYLANVNFKAAYSSDLDRAASTVDTIIKKTGLTAERLAAMRPWNVGVFTGKPKNDVNKRALQSYADTPEIAIPDGESLDEFRARFKSNFERRIQESMELGGPILMVCHASNIHEVGNIVYGDIDAVDIDPGGIVAVYITRDGLSAKAIKGKATESGFGVS